MSQQFLTKYLGFMEQFFIILELSESINIRYPCNYHEGIYEIIVGSYKQKASNPTMHPHVYIILHRLLYELQ